MESRQINNAGCKKRIFLSPPHMSGEEMRFIREAFESNYIAPMGHQVDAFEREVAEYAGIGGAVAEIISEANFSSPKRFKRIGIPDVFADRYGSQASLMQGFGITTENIVATIRDLSGPGSSPGKLIEQELVKE